jgi:hypothetical protein
MFRFFRFGSGEIRSGLEKMLVHRARTPKCLPFKYVQRAFLARLGNSQWARRGGWGMKVEPRTLRLRCTRDVSDPVSVSLCVH